MAKSKKSTINPLGGLLADISTGLLDTISGSTNTVSNVIKHVSGKIITAEQVLTILEELKINQSQYTTEKNVENIIATFLSNFFDVHRQYNIGGFLGLKIDIDLNETVGIEIKLAKELTATVMERLLGQVAYYSRRKYKKKMIVVVVGTAKEQDNRAVEELEDIIYDDLGIHFLYIKVNARK
jgi:hypothetical protein